MTVMLNSTDAPDKAHTQMSVMRAESGTHIRVIVNKGTLKLLLSMPALPGPAPAGG